MKDWLLFASIVGMASAYIWECERLYKQIDDWRQRASLWRDLRIMEGAAESDESLWAFGEIERIKDELRDRGEVP